jgi:hypothetical protein
VRRLGLLIFSFRFVACAQLGRLRASREGDCTSSSENSNCSYRLGTSMGSAAAAVPAAARTFRRLWLHRGLLLSLRRVATWAGTF